MGDAADVVTTYLRTEDAAMPEAPPSPRKALGASKARSAPEPRPEPESAPLAALAPDPRPSVIEALCAVATDLPAIGKNEQHAQGYSYRGIEGIMRSAADVLQRHGVVVMPNVRHRDVESIQVGRDKLWRLVTLEVRFRFYGPRGDFVDAVTVGEGFDPGDKAASKAHTMAFKTALIEVLQIADGDDAEADHRTPAGQVTQEPRRQRQQASPPPRVKSRDEILSEVTEQHGEQHAAAVAALVDVLNETDEAVRETVKREFGETFGNPWRLPPEKLGEAGAWLAATLPATRVG